MDKVDENSRYGKYQTWARHILWEERRRIRDQSKKEEATKLRRMFIKEELLKDIELELTTRRIKINASKITMASIKKTGSTKKNHQGTQE